MANHKSAIKKMRQDEVRRQRNKAYKTRVKTVVKKVEAAIQDQNREAAEQAFKEAVPVIDRVAGKGIIHKNRAARKKSRLAKKINALGASA
jgi:small subunit ribosomal protein S20